MAFMKTKLLEPMYLLLGNEVVTTYICGEADGIGDTKQL